MNVTIEIEKLNKSEIKISSNSFKKELFISKESTSWNTKSINNFLIELSSKVGDKKIEVKVIDGKNTESKDTALYFVYTLFEEFANEINKN
ncbi:MAG: hypothetical protein K4H23_00925 [Mollicutes bacterium PWAP]|nr:hypothetical protein [Mollicutes bacterium PWAP]